MAYSQGTAYRNPPSNRGGANCGKPNASTIRRTNHNASPAVCGTGTNHAE